MMRAIGARLAALAAAVALAGPAAAQQLDPENSDGDHGGFSLTPELDLEGVDELGDVQDVEQPQAAAAEGAVLRGLDRLSGDLSDLELSTGETRRFKRIAVTLGECRFPAGNPSGDAYAYLVIRADGEERPIFEGWMIASSPALNALDHPRYDVWVLRCRTS